MDEKTNVTEQTTDTTATNAAQTVGGETTQANATETLNAFQKFMSTLFSGKTKDEKEQTDEKADEKETIGLNNKAFTEDDFKTALEAEKQKWETKLAEKERLDKLSPAEREKSEKENKDNEIATLRAQLEGRKLKDEAISALEKEGFPIGLADVLNYSNGEAMKASLEKTKEVFKNSLSEAVKQKLRGKTPAGLGGAASAENELQDQIAKNIRGGLR